MFGFVSYILYKSRCLGDKLNKVSNSVNGLKEAMQFRADEMRAEREETQRQQERAQQCHDLLHSLLTDVGNVEKVVVREGTQEGVIGSGYDTTYCVLHAHGSLSNGDNIIIGQSPPVRDGMDSSVFTISVKSSGKKEIFKDIKFSRSRIMDSMGEEYQVGEEFVRNFSSYIQGIEEDVEWIPVSEKTKPIKGNLSYPCQSYEHDMRHEKKVDDRFMGLLSGKRI